MAELNLLENLIKNASLRPPSEKVVDEYFDQIVSCIEQENTYEAAKLIEQVFAKDVPDIRLIVYYFYAHFADHGIKGLGDALPIIKSLVNDHKEILTPKNRIDKHVESSLNWFFSHLLLKLKYYEKMHSAGQIHPIWQKSALDISLEDLDELIATTQDFIDFFLEKWPKSSIKDRVLHLFQKISEIQKMNAEAKKALELNEEAHEEYDDESVLSNENQLDSDSEEKSATAASVTDEKEVDFNIAFDETDFDFDRDDAMHQRELKEPQITQNEVAYPLESIEAAHESLPSFIKSLDDLSRKLKIFEALIEKNDYLKAAVVAMDIDHLIENFDPLNYFPKLFAKYFSLIAKHVAALTDEFDKKDSLQTKSLEKLYRTDLEMFLEW